MSHVIIGTAGHVDHGKTSLIRALTGQDTDRLMEEKKRGITIDLGFASLDLGDGTLAGIVDVPGHERFIRNMLSGAGGIDLALLVVAADEGVMPQTREHLDILRLLQIKKGIVALTKADLVDSDWLALVEEELKEELQGSFLENAAIFPVSSLTGAGIDALKDALITLVKDAAPKKLDAPFRLPIDRVFSMPGFGTVITGTLIEGRLAEGQDVMLYPDKTLTKVRQIQVHSRPCKEAQAGQRVAVNLQRLKVEEVPRGATLAAPDSLLVSRMLDVSLVCLPHAPHPIVNNSRLHFHHGSDENLCKAVLLGGREALLPGEEGYAQLRFENPVAVKPGDPFVLRFYSPVCTVGGGVVLDPAPLKHRHQGDKALEKLSALHTGSPAERLAALVLSADRPAVDRLQVEKQLNLAPGEATALVTALVSDGQMLTIQERWLVHPDALDALGHKAQALLSRYHEDFPLRQGISDKELRDRLFIDLDQQVIPALMAMLADKGFVRSEGGLSRLPDFEVSLTDKQQALTDSLTKAQQEAGGPPPPPPPLLADFGKDAAVVHQYLLDSGALVAVSGEMCLSKAHMDQATAAFSAIASDKGAVSLADFRDALDTSRKYALSILEYWDRKGLTRPEGEARVFK